MPELSASEVAWTKSVTGYDLSRSGPAARPPNSPKGFLERFKPSKPAPPSQPASGQPPPADPALAKALKSLADGVDALKARKFGTARLQSDIDDLQAKAKAAEAETDKAKRTKAVAAATARATEMNRHVTQLLSSIKSVVGKDGDATDEQKSKVYQQALKSLYKIDIEVPKGMTNTHFDRVFDMMGTVPEADVKQSKLKHLVYNTANIGGVYYEEDYQEKKGAKKYKAGTIEMGNFGDASHEEDYQVDGKALKANSFDVTTLHEIGHSVDAKHGIMAKHAKEDGAGGWTTHSLAAVAAAYLAELKATAAPSKAARDADVTAAIVAALSKGTVTQPATIGDDDWQKIAPVLTTKCLPQREKASPFFNATPAILATGLVYTESGGAWFSYKAQARTDTIVNTYQWRSPPEWFAEVYAITWLKKTKPPAKVAAAIAEHCWKA